MIQELFPSALIVQQHQGKTMDNLSDRNTIHAAVQEEVSVPSNPPQSGLQSDGGAQLAVERSSSNGEHWELQSLASAPDFELSDQHSESLQSSREEGEDEEDFRQRMEDENFHKYREVREAWRWHLNRVHSALELFEIETVNVAKDTAKYKRRIDSHAGEVLTHWEKLMDSIVRLHTYARTGVVQRQGVHNTAWLTNWESFNASGNVPFTFVEMCIMLTFEGGKHSFEIGDRSRLSENEELGRQEIFRQIRDRFACAFQGQTRSLYLVNLWRTFTRSHDQIQSGSAGQLGSPNILPVPDILSLLVDDQSPQPPLSMGSTAPPLPLMAEGD